VPVTAKLSKRFYDTFGEQIANELVDWFNKVDETYRTDLRELNELNFARFDAKLEQRFAEFDAKWGTRWTELDAKWGGRWTELDAKLEQRIAELRAELRTETAALRKDIESAFARAEARVEQRLAQVKSDLVKWMFAFWAPTALATVGTALAVVSLLLRR